MSRSAVLLVVLFGFAMGGCATQQLNKKGKNCEYRPITGSHIPTLVCATAEQTESRREMDQDAARRLQQKDQMRQPAAGGPQ